VDCFPGAKLFGGRAKRRCVGLPAEGQDALALD